MRHYSTLMDTAVYFPPRVLIQPLIRLRSDSLKNLLTARSGSCFGLSRAETCPTLRAVIPAPGFRTRNTPRSCCESSGPSGRRKASTTRCWLLMERSFRCRRTSWLLPALTSGKVTQGGTWVGQTLMVPRWVRLQMPVMTLCSCRLKPVVCWHFSVCSGKTC